MAKIDGVQPFSGNAEGIFRLKRAIGALAPILH